MMHGEQPSHAEGEYQPPASRPLPQPAGPPPAPPGPPRKGWRNAGGAAVALAFLAAKFKTILALLLSFKWLFLGGKFALSFGSIFVSIWFYALYFGWKLGVVFVLLILVHEMGHWVVLRGFGVKVSLPYFIPGLGAFVAQKERTANNVQDAASAFAGPAIGIAASAICQAYGVATGNPFWIAAAHIGYLINLFNLIPVLPLDGGRIAGSIHPRLWIVGLAVFAVYFLVAGLHSPMALVIIALIAASTFRRAIAAWRGGTIDPRVRATPPAVRAGIAAVYVATIVLGFVATAATNIAVPQ